MSESCPFCNLPRDRIIDSDELGLVIRDGYPISPGHTLIIPKWHIASFFDLSIKEQDGLFELMARAKEVLLKTFNPDGFNVGINDVPSAGQTVPHIQIHLIPRFKDDQEDARGGVRWIIPDKARYWE